MANNNDTGIVGLNNYLQNIGKGSALSWEDHFTGPRHAGEWTSVCKIDGQAYGTGTGAQKNVARDVAATAALTAYKDALAAQAVANA